ncbi:diguanylate cyclase [Massilia oculi]|uniref:GGDEF-domain containing protein n=1 Tax=Massilia oculi TaxID=945844 RepID=A0A2S2DNE7_9BURK|nr:diguanylate cyclase [Massilia oculi]AWL06892.1 GGDEF-domain containing protein [Massilia oculi]
MSDDSTQRWSARYLGIAQRFIPAALQQDVTQAARSANLVNAAVMAGTAGPLYALAYWLLGLETAAVEIVLCCAVMLSAAPVLRLTGSVVAAREVFLCALFFNFSWLSWHLGGIVSPTVSWLVTGPLVAMFLGGKRCAGFWLAMSCASATLIYLLEANGLARPPAPRTDMPLLHLVCDLGLYVVVLVFVLLFGLTKNDGFSRLRRALATINELAIRDELTGIHNRRFLLDLVDKEKERADRNGGEFCLCLFDIDFFKRINDTYGHAAGDTVLRAFSRTVQDQLRALDAFGRYGGEEFLLMLPETPAASAIALAERVRGAVEGLRCLDGERTITLTVSAGVAEYRLGEKVAQTIVRADQALYLAKSGGRNRVLCHGDDGPAEVARGLAAPVTDARAPLDGADGFQRDQLTGLLNRRLLRDRLRHAMDRARRNGRLVALLLLNINRFKEVNDALGYEAGDALLHQAGGAIRRCLRDCDTVARWGGDEFVALLEDLGSQADALLVADKILDRLTAPLAVAGRDCYVTLAVGIALYPAPDCDADALLKRADTAMRSAKRWGQNIVRVYAGNGGGGAGADAAACSLSLPQSERLALKNGLRDALAQGQLFIEYQPQVELRERRVIGVEALLRWQHPVYGLIDPGRFIPLAEETGMIVPIGEWMLRCACLQNRAWRAAGLPEIKTAVNLSARQLREPGLAGRMLAIVAETGMPPACLDLEITEGILIDDLAANCTALSQLRQAGVLVSIDDFGTGYSSLNYLSALPVDILKMDGLFVRRLGAASGRARAYAVADSIVAMAHRLGLSVIAESVETPEQLGDLCAMGVDAAQGYLFDRPLAPELVAALLARQRRECAAAMLAPTRILESVAGGRRAE